MMAWGSMQAFLDMGGHGRFVWGAYAMALGLMAGEAWLVRRRLRRAADEARALAGEVAP